MANPKKIRPTLVHDAQPTLAADTAGSARIIFLLEELLASNLRLEAKTSAAPHESAVSPPSPAASPVATISVNEAAERFGKSPSCIYKAIRSKHIGDKGPDGVVRVFVPYADRLWAKRGPHDL